MPQKLDLRYVSSFALCNCRRAVARQPTILYSSEICPKYVGCKIVDLRSRMRSLYPSACEFGDMRSRFLYIWDMLVNARGNIDRFRATAVYSIKDTLTERGQFLYRCLLLSCGRIHQGHERFMTVDDPQGRQLIFKCLAVYSNLCPLR